MRYKGKKGKAWEAVRAYVKTVEKHCYTCPARNLEGKNAQAGHYLPVGLIGSNNKLSWDETQIHLQCGHCNGAGQGMQVQYRLHLLKDYGKATVIALEARKYKVDPVKNWDAMIVHYENLQSKAILKENVWVEPALTVEY